MKRHYSDWIKAFVSYASIGEAPVGMYFWTGVSTVAGALRRRVWIDQGFFRWLSNFYIILVAPPGIVSKSTTAAIGMNLLRAVGGEKTPYIKFGPDVVTWQALVKSLAESLEMVQMPDGLFYPQSSVTIESSEFGNLITPANTEMLDILVTLWDGKATGNSGTFSKMTKTQGSDKIQNPWINIIACTTPAWIAGNFPEYTIGGGFVSRCIFVYAKEKRQLVAYPSTSLPPEFLDMQKKLIHDLEIISMIAGPYELEPKALQWGELWYEQHHNHRPAHLDNARFGGYIARKQTHAHKLAMIISAARRSERVILLEDLEEAVNMVSMLEESLPLVFSSIGRSDEAKHIDEMLSYIRNKGEIEWQALFREMFRVFGDSRAFESAINSCRSAGYIRTDPSPEGIIVRALQ